MTRWTRTLAASVAMCLAVGSATAQPQDPAAPDRIAPTKRKTDFPTIRWHLQATLEHARLGRGHLSQPASIETFQAAAKEIYKAYVRVRDAHAGILGRIGRAEKFKDPLLDQYEKRIQSVRSELLVALDQANNGARLRQFGRAGPGIESLNRAMKNVEFVLAVIP